MFTWENSHRREFHTEITFWFRIAFTWWLGHFISRYLKVHFMLIKYTCDSKSQPLRMRYPFQSTGRSISHLNGWFRVYMIPYWSEILSPVLQPEWTNTGVTLAGLTFCGGIMSTNIRAMSRLSRCTDRASGEVSRWTCFAWMDLNHYKFTREKEWLTYAMAGATWNIIHCPIDHLAWRHR